jgi:uncharacterized OB-fold protein
MSRMGNLAFVKEKGMEAFLENERLGFSCPHCGHLVSVHRENCMNCGEKWIE